MIEPMCNALVRHTSIMGKVQELKNMSIVNTQQRKKNQRTKTYILNSRNLASFPMSANFQIVKAVGSSIHLFCLCSGWRWNHNCCASCWRIFEGGKTIHRGWRPSSESHTQLPDRMLFGTYLKLCFVYQW